MQYLSLTSHFLHVGATSVPWSCQRCCSSAECSVQRSDVTAGVSCSPTSPRPRLVNLLVFRPPPPCSILCLVFFGAPSSSLPAASSSGRVPPEQFVAYLQPLRSQTSPLQCHDAHKQGQAPLPPKTPSQRVCLLFKSRCTDQRCTEILPGQDKQAQLLSEEVGHFSMVRALHLADLITTLNGTSDFALPCRCSTALVGWHRAPLRRRIYR